MTLSLPLGRYYVVWYETSAKVASLLSSLRGKGLIKANRLPQLPVRDNPKALHWLNDAVHAGSLVLSLACHGFLGATQQAAAADQG
jgi:hypothetical protein